MRLFTLPALASAALVSAVLVLPFLPIVRDKPGQFALEARIASSAEGHVEVYFDTGHGLNEKDSTAVRLRRSDTPQLYRLALPAGSYGYLRFDPIDRDGTVTIASARIVDALGSGGRDIPLSAFKPLNQIQSMRDAGGRLEVQVVPGGNDPQLLLVFDPPLSLKMTATGVAVDWFRRAAWVFAALIALYLVARAARLPLGAPAVLPEMAKRPGWTVAVVSAVAAIGSAYPVVFLGKSYVSPNYGTSLLYDTTPTLPGYTSDRIAAVSGSDVGSIIWGFVPYSMAQHRDLLSDHELPLWNRWNSCGEPFLGQGYSMFGDPLHLLPVLANGAAWAWDLRYLLSKWLFAVGLGLLVLAVTGNVAAAAIVCLAAPFVGFFLYRLNHPAFFGLCYGPWPLYCWVRMSQTARPKAFAGWSLGLILANFALMNTGGMKEAWMMMLNMNFSGFCVLVSAAEPVRVRLLKCAGAAGAGVLFALIAGPIVVSFLETLESAYSFSNAPSAFQIQPALMLGAFDEAFYRPLTKGDLVFNPSANFLILGGLLYFLASLRSHWGNRTVVVLAATSLIPLSFAFGFFPPAWVEQIPLVGNVAHIDNSFTCPLIVLWAVLAGAGFAAAAGRLATREGRDDLVTAALLLFALIFSYVAFGQAVHRSLFGPDATVSVWKQGESMPVSPLVWGYLAILVSALVGLALIVRSALRRGKLSAIQGAGLALCTVALLWRQGLQAETAGFEDYVGHPAVRADFHAKSDAVAFVQAAQSEAPSRSVGLNGNFAPGWTGVYALEGICGPDPLISNYYHELTSASPVPLIWGWRLYLTRDAVAASRPFLDFLNVRHYFDLPGDEASFAAPFRPVYSGDLDVYESPTVWPRAFFTDRLAVYDEPKDLVQRIVSGDGRPFGAVQSTELASSPLLGALRGELQGRTIVPATHYRLSENSTSFSVRAPGPGLVVLSEVWWPGYPHAEMDGQRAAVIRVNHAFEGLLIPAAGDHEITVVYRPRRFGLLLGLALASLLVLAVAAAAALRKP